MWKKGRHPHFVNLNGKVNNRSEENSLIPTKGSIRCAAIIGLGIVNLIVLQAPAQQAQDLSSQSGDLKISAALKDISAQQIQADIEKLVSFKTRSTISAQDGASIAAGRG